MDRMAVKSPLASVQVENWPYHLTYESYLIVHQGRSYIVRLSLRHHRENPRLLLLLHPLPNSIAYIVYLIARPHQLLTL